jgi:hypothetical protein
MVVKATTSRPSRTPAGSLARLTADKYHRMIQDGIIADDATTELLDGIIVNKDRSVLGGDPMGHSPLHAMVVSLLAELAVRINGPSRHLRTQLPISISAWSEPEPDAAIVRGRARDYREKIPAAADVFCVIEAAHSSLGRDRDDKLPAYAGGGIPQYVIINLAADSIEIHGDPDAASATYRTQITAGRGQIVRLFLGNSDFLEIAAEELLP